MTNRDELIERLRSDDAMYGSLEKLHEAAADALELADKRIAELEKEAQFNFEQYQDAGRLLCEANEKLAVAREALIQLANAADNQGAFTGMSWQQAKAVCTAALAQIAATEQK